MRIAVLAAAICLSIVGLSAAGESKASIRKDTNIPAGGLGPALQTLAKTYDFQVLYRTEVVGELRTQGAVGTMTAPEALKQVLSGTGLSFKYLDDNTVTIISVATSATPLSSAQSGEAAAPAQDVNVAQKEGKKSSSGGFLLAQVAQGAPAGPASVERKSEQSSASKPVTLEEVIVTAQKRNERLQDVPVPVTAISTDTLLASNQLRLQDYYTMVPGLDVTPDDARGFPLLTIRGITTGGYTNPSVGITVDDVPYGSSTSLGFGFAAPDIDPSDLASVEVLRGPQGTLYGASSIGGLVKFVTVDPSTTELSGRVEAGTSGVVNGAEMGYNFRGSVNLPLTDTWAIRASGFTRQDPGYIDNVETGQRGINKGDVYGSRLSALWRPSEAFSLKLSALYQDSKRHGSNDVYSLPGLGDLQQSASYGAGYVDQKFQAYSAVLTAKLGLIDFTAVSGYNIYTLSDSIGGAPGKGLGRLTQNLFGLSGAPILDANKTKKFTQEIRLTATVGHSVDLLCGAFYTHEHSPVLETLVAENPATGATPLDWGAFNWAVTYAEYAAFADLTFHLSDRFDIQVGGRESHNRQTFEEVDSGQYATMFEGASPFVYPPVDTSENAFTYLVTPRFKLSPDLMLYARLASGFRPGGPNASPTLGVPPAFDPDKTQNYEIGVKGDVLNHAISFDASVYYIDWKNIQLYLTDPTTFLSYYGNGSRAKSQGVELSMESKPLSGLTLATWVAWSDAVLTENFPPNSAVPGFSDDRLPDSSRFSGNFSVRQDFPLGSSVSAFVGGSVSYVGDRLGVFTYAPPAVPPRQVLPGYTKADLHGGARYDSWTLNFFVNNVADRRGALTGGLGTSPTPYGFNYIQPRTVGLSVVKTF